MKAFDLVSIATLEEAGAIIAIQDGNHGAIHPKSADYVQNGIAFVMASDIQAGQINLKDASKISEAQASKLRIGFAKEGDVLLTHKGTIGSVAIVGPVDPYIMLTPQVTYYRVDERQISRKYLSLAFREREFQKRIKSLSEQSTRPYIGITGQRRLQIIWTPYDLQQRVAATIAAYDDLIENNRRRIALLEEAARQLYKEWFVRFRFPGHEHVKIIDGVPEGWNKIPASEAILINPTTRWTAEGEIKAVPMAAVSENGMCCDEAAFESRSKSTSVRFVDGDTLFARITPCLENGKTAFVNFLTHGEVACGSTEFVVLRERQISRFVIYLLAREESFRGNAIQSMIGSSGRQRVQPNCFDKYMVCVPPRHIGISFDNEVEPLFALIRTIDRQNRQLAKARDLLLPKLMSGAITV